MTHENCKLQTANFRKTSNSKFQNKTPVRSARCHTVRALEFADASEKRQRTAALQNLAAYRCTAENAPASWSAAVLCRFGIGSDVLYSVSAHYTPWFAIAGFRGGRGNSCSHESH